jgi:hypothetical protein
MPTGNCYRLIARSVVPVVVISVSGLRCLAFYNRLANIVTRLRMFQRELMQQQELRDGAIPAKDTKSAASHERVIDLLAERPSMSRSGPG